MAETAKVYKYTVLREVASNNPDYPVCYVVVGHIGAKTPLDAEKAMASKHGAGTYVATTKWAPHPLRSNVVETFILDDAPAPVAAPAAEVTA